VEQARKNLKKLRNSNKNVFNKVDKEIIELGIENNELGDRAVSYLYCVEANCPECGKKYHLLQAGLLEEGQKQ